MECPEMRDGAWKLAWLTLVLITLVVIASAACTTRGIAAGPPRDRTIYMAAIEPKGSTTAEMEPFPAQQLPAGPGYGLKPPDGTGKWVVETYRFAPGTVVVNEGDTVTLEIVGINGEEHPIIIEEYGVSTVLKRGEVQRLTFVAEQPGIFKIVCTIHTPSMQADLVVLKR